MSPAAPADAAAKAPAALPPPGAAAKPPAAKELEGLTTAQANELREQYGYNEVKPKQTPEWRKIAWRYLDWVSLVILAAAIVSIAVENDGDRGYTSFVLLLIELNLVVWVGYWTDKNAGNAIKELEELAAPIAVVRRDGAWGELAVRDLVPGDILALKGGDVIPADCKLVGHGEPLKIDESSLTGESLAVTRRVGDKVLAGAVVASGELDAMVTATGAETFFGKTMALLGTPQERGHLQTVLGRVSAALGIIGLAGVAAVFGVLVARGDGVGYAIITAMVIFVSVVPIGMPVVTGAVLAAGAREMVAEKAIVSRLSALEELSGMEVLCSDKTGTLTLNRLTLDKADIQAWGSFTADDVLLMASMSAKWSNQDAIDRAVTAAVGGDPEKALKGWNITRLIPFDPVSKRTIAEVTTPDGRAVQTAKGAPQIIRDMCDDATARDAVDTYIAERASRGLRALGVAQSVDGGATWQMVGLISLLDPPREDSAETIRQANALGVEVKMVTGDQAAIAAETSRRLGLGTNIMEGSELMAMASSNDGWDEQLAAKANEVDGFAGVYPEHKYLIVQALQGRGRLIGMTGDGVNDAPALKKANVGIAVAGATAAAKGAADIILTEEGISTIVTAIKRSRKIFRRLEAYIIYRMASSLIILGFFVIAIIVLKLEFPTFALVLISLTNDLSVMATSWDKVHSSDVPEMFNMTRSLSAAFAIAVVGAGSTIFLQILADPERMNWWHIWNTSLNLNTDYPAGITNGQVVAVIYLGLTAFIQTSIFLTRNHSFWWHFSKKSSPRPSWALVIPVSAFILMALFIGVYWPAGAKPDGGKAVMDGAGWVPCLVTLLYVFVWLQVADLLKVLVQRLFRKQEQIKERCHERGETPPSWVRWMDAPGDWCERQADQLEDAVSDCITGMCSPLVAAIERRRLKNVDQKDVAQRVMATRLGHRDRRGRMPEDSSFGSSTGAPTQVAIEVRPDAKPAAGTAVPVHVGALDLESAGTANRVDA